MGRSIVGEEENRDKVGEVGDGGRRKRKGDDLAHSEGRANRIC